MSRFYLVRHGNTIAGSILPGRLPGYSLSEHGRTQIELLTKAYLLNKRFDKFLCSPVERAFETAEIISGITGARPEVHPALNEVDFGDWTGKSFEFLEELAEWKLFHSFRSGAVIPHGESIADIQKRVIDLVLAAHHNYPEGNILFVTHAEVIRVIISHFSGLPLDNSYRVEIGTGSLSIVKLAGAAFIECINITGNAS